MCTNIVWWSVYQLGPLVVWVIWWRLLIGSQRPRQDDDETDGGLSRATPLRTPGPTS